jgi:hypothetical protein
LSVVGSLWSVKLWSIPPYAKRGQLVAASVRVIE